MNMISIPKILSRARIKPYSILAKDIYIDCYLNEE